MKSLLLILSLYLGCTFPTFGSSVNHKKAKVFFKATEFEVLPLNSPVKEAFAKFKLKLPPRFEVDSVKIKLVNTRDLSKDQKQFESVDVKNNEIWVSVSKLSPGFYRLFISIKDKKSQKEELFQKNFHDFVRFVVDESLEVPMPNKSLNNATLEGVDSDKNGIRDDIQRFINENFSNKPSTKLAMKQVAQSMQQKLVNSIDPQTTEIYAHKIAEDLSCLNWISSQPLKLVEELQIRFKNTEQRIKKTLQINEWFHGGNVPKSILEFEKTGSKDDSVFCAFENASKEQ